MDFFLSQQSQQVLLDAGGCRGNVRRQVIAAGTPSATRAGRVGVIGELLIENGARSGQCVERQRIDPLVAIAAQRA
jgi:hypothetical protein